MITESIFIGILLGYIYYELVGLTPGGIIVPGYIALYLDRPLMLLVTLLAVLLTMLLIMGLSRIVILYGRRTFLAAIIIGFLLKYVIESFLIGAVSISADLAVIGYIIPGLIAHEIRRQGTVPTLASLAMVSTTTFVLISVVQHYK